MNKNLKVKLPNWLLVDNSGPTSIFCLSIMMIVLSGCMQFLIRLTYVAESSFFFPLYFLATTILLTVGIIGVSCMVLYTIAKAIRAMRHGVFMEWLTDCIQDLNERPKLKLDQHIINEQNRKKLEDEMNIAINKFKKFEAKIQKDTTQK